MEFHRKKCNILRVSRSRCPSTYYTLRGTPLKELEEGKYIGIAITKDLSWENIYTTSHVKRTVNLVSYEQCEGWIYEDKRNTLQHTGRPTSRVRSLCVGPSCFQAKTGNGERTATSSQMGYYNQHDSVSSVTAMLKELDWQPLELRRSYFCLCLLYQITKGITFLISCPTVMLRVHHDMRTHCNMRNTNAGQTILNILKPGIHDRFCP